MKINIHIKNKNNLKNVKQMFKTPNRWDIKKGKVQEQYN